MITHGGWHGRRQWHDWHGYRYWHPDNCYTLIHPPSNPGVVIVPTVSANTTAPCGLSGSSLGHWRVGQGVLQLDEFGGDLDTASVGATFEARSDFATMSMLGVIFALLPKHGVIFALWRGGMLPMGLE